MSFVNLPFDIFSLFIELMPTKILKRKLYYALRIAIRSFGSAKSQKINYQLILKLEPFMCRDEWKSSFAINSPQEFLNACVSDNSNIEKHKNIIEYITLTKDGQNLMYNNMPLLRNLLLQFDRHFIIKQSPILYDKRGCLKNIYRIMQKGEVLEWGILHGYGFTEWSNLTYVCTINFCKDVYERIKEYKLIALNGIVLPEEYRKLKYAAKQDIFNFLDKRDIPVKDTMKVEALRQIANKHLLTLPNEKKIIPDYRGPK